MIFKGNNALSGYFARTGQHSASPPEIVLTEDTETGRGNFILAHWTLNNHLLAIKKGNCRRMYWRQTDADDFQLLDPVNLPVNVTNVNNHYKFIDHVHRIEEPMALAVTLRRKIKTWTGQDGLDAFDFSVESLHADLTATQGEWEAEAGSWANKSGLHVGREGKTNTLKPIAALERISDLLVEIGTIEEPPDKFVAVAALIRSESVSAWHGEDQLVEELS